MNIKTTFAVGGLLSIALATMPGIAQAHHKGKHRTVANNDYWVEARVMRVEPIVRFVTVSTPREVCWEEQVVQPAHYEKPSATPQIVGAILGGTIGNKFGNGRGNTIMTAAGALLGASIGADQARARQPYNPGYVTTEQRCALEETTHQEERHDGYNVTYRYAGQDFITRTSAAPGRTIRVRVQLQPVAYNGYRR